MDKEPVAGYGLIGFAGLGRRTLFVPQVVFAAYGTRATVDISGRDGLFATITPAGRHSVTATDTAMHQALLDAGSKALSSGEPAAADTAMLLSYAVRPWGVRVHAFDSTTTRFLTAGTAVRREGVDIEELGMRSTAPGRAFSDVVHLALVTDGDTPAEWLHTGQALSAISLTCVTLGIGLVITDAVQSIGERMLLRSLAARDGQPQLLLKITT